MRTLKVGFILVLIPMVFLVFKSTYSSVQQIPNADELQPLLTKVALASLRSESDILVTGENPTDMPVPQHDGMTHSYRTGEERIATAIRVREGMINAGMPYTKIEIRLSSHGVKKDGDKIILHAIEEKAEHFTYTDPARNSAPTLTESRINHDFIFSLAPETSAPSDGIKTINFNGYNYTLVEDITEPQLVKH